MQRRTISRLVRILGLLGSDQPGERASAALAAHRLVTTHGASWADLLQPAPVITTKVVVRRVRDYDLDQQASPPRLRRRGSLKSSNERLEKEVLALRRRLAAIAERQRKLAMAEADDEA